MSLLWGRKPERYAVELECAECGMWYPGPDLQPNSVLYIQRLICPACLWLEEEGRKFDLWYQDLRESCEDTAILQDMEIDADKTYSIWKRRK